jgi:catalase
MTDVASQGPAEGDDRRVLTDRQGHPVYDNQNQRTVGERGPATLENYQFLEKMSHFDRERIPERVVHARGATAFGFFEAYGAWGDEPISRYTRAKLFQEKGKRCETAVRFSTVAGGRDSSEAVRDPRGFAVKMYTEDGNWDLVGNNLGVFFLRDAIKFPDFIHSQKPDPVTFERQVPNRVFDFISQTPEALHMVTLVFGPRGIPASYRTQQGFGVNTYKWVNAAGETKLVKYHWLPKQGVKSMTAADAAAVQAGETGAHTKDLYDAIERGDHPEWELCVQMMDDHDHPELDWDPLDDTKVWPENDFPVKPVGRMVLDRSRATSSSRASRSRSAPACSWTGWTSPTTRCSSAARSPTPTPSATASARTTCSCRSTRPRRRGAHEPARRPDGLLPGRGRREPARQLRAVDHRRPARGRVPRPTTSRARSSRAA